MNKCVSFYVPGKPKGKGRPRFGNGHAYTPKTTHDYEKLIAEQYIAKYGVEPTKEACQVWIKAVFALPKSLSKKERERIIGANEYPLKKPDVDNVAKVVLDALNGIAYEDDVQVYRVIAKREYEHQADRSEGLYIDIAIEEGF